MDNTRTYNTWHQFVRAADNINDLNPNRRHSRDKSKPIWSGTDSFEETIHLASRGWPEGLKKVRNNIQIIERFISPRQPRKELAYGVRGPGILDLERYQQGRPDSWLGWEEHHTQEGMSTKIVPIVFNLSASGGVNASVLFNRGAAVCALIDMLEHHNIRVELTLAEKARYPDPQRKSSSDYTWKVLMKHSEDVLDMDRIAFALCNASVLRRLMFSLAEQHVENLFEGYGSPLSHKEPGAINIDAASLYIRNESDMVPWLVTQLAGYGIEVQD